jgi:hypothetical protein
VARSAVHPLMFLVLALIASGFAGSARAQSDFPRIEWHGTLSAAYAKCESGSVPFVGLSPSGTTDYRIAGLQFNYVHSDSDRFVIQLLHRRLGRSPLTLSLPEIALVDAFYEREIRGFVMHAGRVPFPRGLLNEIRYVGTLLSMFRAPPTVYGESFEYLDGVTVSHTRPLTGDWVMQADLGGGGFDFRWQGVDPATGQQVVTVVRREDGVGGRLLVGSVPLGARVAISGWYSRAESPPPTVPALLRSRIFSLVYSAEVDRSHAFVRSEYSFGSSASDGAITGWYVQGGVRPVARLELSAQYAESGVISAAPVPGIGDSFTSIIDRALAGKWNLTSETAIKAEVGERSGYVFDQTVPTILPPDAGHPLPRLAPPTHTAYGMLSIAYAF